MSLAASAAVPVTLIVYGVITIAFRAYGRRLLSMLPPRRRINNFVLIVGRGAIAGLMVALVSTASEWLAPAASGMLLAFPIGYTVLAITVHQTMGVQHAMLMLYTGLFGTVSLAAFAAVAYVIASALKDNGIAALCSCRFLYWKARGGRREVLRLTAEFALT